MLATYLRASSGIRFLQASTGKAASSLSVNKPSATYDTALLVAAMIASDNAGTWTGDTGWSEKVDQGAIPNLRVATKVASAEGASYAFAFSVGSSHPVGVVALIRKGAYDLIGSVGTRSGTGTLTTTGITMSGPGLLLAFVAVTNDDGTVTSDNGMLLKSQFETGGTAYPGLYCFRQYVAAGATGNRTFTIGGTPGEVSGVLVGIKRA